MPGSDQMRSKPRPRYRKTNSGHGESKPGGSGAHRAAWFETFNVHSVDDASLKRMMDTIGASPAARYRTCIVSIISQESLGQSVREKLVKSILHHRTELGPVGEEANSRSKSTPSEFAYENQILGEVDVNEGLVVLSLESFLDANKLLSLCENENSQPYSANDGTHRPPDRSILIKTWPEWNQNLLKALLILFTLSNIIIFYNSESYIHCDLVRLLRLCERQRVKSQRRIGDLLATIASGQVFSQQWVRSSRICCPRALFVCDTSHMGIDSSNYRLVRDRLEDQISYLLKKAGLLQTLVCVPEDEDFVYILTKWDIELIGVTKSQPNGTDNSGRSQERPVSRLMKPPCRPSRFAKFIKRHIDSMQNLANNQEGKLAAGKQVAHIIPRFDDFFNVLFRLKCLLFPSMTLEESADSQPDWSKPDERRFIDMYDSSNIDVLFSRQHCQKARLAALDLYKQGLQVEPGDKRLHERLLESAKSFYNNHARGVAQSCNLDLLIESCNRYWLEAAESTNESQSRGDTVRTRRPSKGRTPSLRSLAITRKPNGSVRVASSCQCGHETNLIIKPNDRRKKLERIDVYQINN